MLSRSVPLVLAPIHPALMMERMAGTGLKTNDKMEDG